VKQVKQLRISTLVFSNGFLGIDGSHHVWRVFVQFEVLGFK